MYDDPTELIDAAVERGLRGCLGNEGPYFHDWGPPIMFRTVERLPDEGEVLVFRMTAKASGGHEQDIEITVRKNRPPDVAEAGLTDVWLLDAMLPLTEQIRVGATSLAVGSG